MRSQLEAAEFQALFRRAAVAEKARVFSPVQLQDLLEKVTALESRQDRVSGLRFALRLADRSGQDNKAIIDSLRSAYAEAANEQGRSDVSREKLLAWWRRYGGISASSTLGEVRRICYQGTMEQLAERASEGDWDYCFNRTARVLECWTGAECLFGNAKGVWSPFTGTVLGQVNEGAFAVQNGVWQCAGKTHVGVPGGDYNDDAIGVCAGEDAHFLLAVADGTGDSRFGSRASTIALKGLIDAWCAGVSLEWAVKLAASKLRADNCAHGLDGACTLAACVLHDAAAELIAVGDAFFVCVGTDGQVHKSVFDKNERSVLGGEPLGWTITSSGRLVENLHHGSRVNVIRIYGADRVLLGSDGVCAPDLNESVTELTEMLGRSGSPNNIVENLLAGAQDRSRKTGAYDNISAVVALR